MTAAPSQIRSVPRGPCRRFDQSVLFNTTFHFLTGIFVLASKVGGILHLFTALRTKFFSLWSHHRTRRARRGIISRGADFLDFSGHFSHVPPLFAGLLRSAVARQPLAIRSVGPRLLATGHETHATMEPPSRSGNDWTGPISFAAMNGLGWRDRGMVIPGMPAAAGWFPSCPGGFGHTSKAFAG
jgi:hypothetical protein